MPAEDYIGKEMKRMILRMRILIRISQGRAHSYGMMKEFKAAGFAKFMGPGIKNDIYNTIKSLEQGGYIRTSARTAGSGVKKYYVLTPKGKVLMKSALTIQRETLRQISMLFR